MTRLRTILIGAALSLTLIGGAAGAAGAQETEGPHPFGRECVSHIATMHDGGVGPHIRGMHQDTSVGQHLQMMRTSDHACMHMESGDS